MTMTGTMKRWLLTAIMLGAFSGHAAIRPNILYFYVDDMGWGSIGPNGQDDRRTAGLPDVKTPNLDTLAAQGINFRRAYGCTVCSPARSSQQLGFHQGHTWADRNNTDNAKKAMRADDVTMGDALKAAGYVTGYWGKWGYGASQDQSNPVILNLQTLPTSHGYDHVLAELHHVRAHTFYQPTLWSAPAAPGAFGGLELKTNSISAYMGDTFTYPDYPARQNNPDYPDPANPVPHAAYCDDSYCFAALDFVRTQGQNYNATGQPFFGLLAVQVPHSPYNEIEQLPEWYEAYSNNPHFFPTDTAEKSGALQWAAMVTRIDAHIGNILAALEDPNNDGDTSDSVADDTLVIFMSDNGGPGNKARSYLNANGGLRGSKGSIWEGGIRVPMIVRWPSMITAGSALQAGTDSRFVVDASDLLPTFCELAGIEAPAGLDGVSIAPTLTGADHQRPREFLIHEAGSSSSIIRGNHKLVRTSSGLELYDLDSDPAESTDIAAANPSLVAELEALLLGECVTESQWTANTYHDWIGTNEAAVSSAANWSDYIYSNVVNGLVYDTDNGAPRIPWTATMENTNLTGQTAVLDSDVELLSLHIEGNTAAGAKQTLSFLPGKKLTGRNEIRLSPFAAVQLNGILSSLRWVDVLPDAVIEGHGLLDTALYNAGTLSIDAETLSITNMTIDPGIADPQYVHVSDAANSIAKGSSDRGTFATVSLVGDNTAPPGTLVHTISNLTLDDTGEANDSIRVEFEVTTDGQNIQTSATNKNGWLSSGGGTLNANGEFVQLSNTLVRVDLNGGAGNGTAAFGGFTEVEFSSWGANHTGVVNGISQGYVDGTDDKTITLPNDTIWKAWFDTAANTGADSDAAGSWRPDNWNFTLAITGLGVPASTNMTIESVTGMAVSGNYRQSAGALLEATIGSHTSLTINGSAILAGKLDCLLPAGFSAVSGDRFTVLSADSVTGTFSNADGMIEKDGHHFRIHYRADQVELEKVSVTAKGTPHWWLEQYGLTNDTFEVEDLLDIDGDGLAAWEEYIAGTHPGLFSSGFALEAEVQPLENGFIVNWPSVAERFYDLQRGTNILTGFQPLETGIPATPPKNSYTDSVQAAEAFYRVRADK